MKFFRKKRIEVILAESLESQHSLRRVLEAKDLILLGIGGIIGAGIFATVGTAAVGDGLRPGAGPAIVLSFIITAVACGFTALCYSELASMVPISGSAYTYAYITMGEFIAWIIGWDLIIEYAIGNVAIAISWSGYFNEFIRGFGVEIPQWLVTDYRSAFSGDRTYLAARALADGALPDAVRALYGNAAAVVTEKVAGGMDVRYFVNSYAPFHRAIVNAPRVFGVPVIFNLPAVAITGAITMVLVAGIRESARFNSIMVGVKIVILCFFVFTGMFYVKPGNWTPFAPHGWAGIQAGAAVVFFAYIGFDAVSTAAEETVNPRRNLPIGIIGSLVISTIVYVLVALILTGMVPVGAFTQANKAEPLAVAMNYNNLSWAAGIISLGSVVAHTAVLLVLQMGQTRIFYSMARDGLLPKVFSRVHPKFRTPHVNTILTGLFVAFFAAFTNIDEIVDLTNIGTLFSFILVCLGVLILRRREPEHERSFRVPLIGLTSLVGVGMCLYLVAGLPTVTYLRFLIWLAVGVVVYFTYGYRKSRLNA